jgi:SAM-dependent methyltransferase
MEQEQFLKDREATAFNRQRLSANQNLLYWYKRLFAEMFKGIDNVEGKLILEVGSGTSPLKLFYPRIKTSDLLPMDYLDYVFDAHHIDRYQPVSNESLDIIVLVNVLHHLHEPLSFLKNAATKLKPGGMVIFTEPYLSFISYFIYRYLHHETLDLNINNPVLTEIKGPLSSSNQALPYLIFFKRSDWLSELNSVYHCESMARKSFTSISYMATGGISRRFPILHWLYRIAFDLDKSVADHFPRFAAAFFIAKLVRR